MIDFDVPNINLEKPSAENMKRLKSFLEETVDKLNMLSAQVEKLEKERND